MKEFRQNSESIHSIEQLEIGMQFDFQIRLLTRRRIIKDLPNLKKPGIQGIDGQEYEIPTSEEVIGRLKASEKSYLEKVNQLTRIQFIVVPFAYSLERLAEKCGKAITNHHKVEKLLAAKNEVNDSDEPLVPAGEIVLLKQGFYNDCDTENKIVYFPKEFSKNHGGQTKLELLKANRANAWQFWLIEDIPNIPKEGEGKVIGGRKQLEVGKSPSEYLKILQRESEYKGEVGLIPEAELMYFLTHLETTNQVINDSENGSTSCQTGAYFPSADFVPHLLWFRHWNQLWLNGLNPEKYYSSKNKHELRGPYSNNGARFGVMI